MIMRENFSYPSIEPSVCTRLNRLYGAIIAITHNMHFMADKNK